MSVVSSDYLLRLKIIVCINFMFLFTSMTHCFIENYNAALLFTYILSWSYIPPVTSGKLVDVFFRQLVTKVLHGQLLATLLDSYRATRLHSVDYAVGRCLVRPSVTRRYSVEMAKISSVFSPLVQPHHSSFAIPNGMAIFQRRPSKRGRPMQMGYEKNHDFRPISRKQCKIEPQLLLRKANRKPHPSFRMVAYQFE